jgi:hypothetical protein
LVHTCGRKGPVTNGEAATGHKVITSNIILAVRIPSRGEKFNESALNKRRIDELPPPHPKTLP